jgi:anti-sigma regulatory factor (Ser/Thr protein kinase)/anti-anti-sigma regulatory factor
MNTITFSNIHNLELAIQAYEKIKNHSSHKNILILDFSKVTFIKNQYYALLGLALKMYHSNKEIEFILPIHTSAKTNMKNIGFLSEFTEINKGFDLYKTMVQYTHIPMDKQELKKDFYRRFFNRFNERVSNLSPKLLKKINQSISELFENVFIHSYSDLGLFCVGQFYPQNNKFSFIIADGGITIKNNVNNFLNKDFSGIETIKWALIEGHSTTQGGFGLTIVKNLVQLQKGKLEIISNDGYYQLENGKEKTLLTPFDGTIVSIELNIDDKFYYLKGEQNENNH